jgi:hypothetical protein
VGLHFGDVPVGLGKMSLSVIHGFAPATKSPAGAGL